VFRNFNLLPPKGIAIHVFGAMTSKKLVIKTNWHLWNGNGLGAPRKHANKLEYDCK
jgi:hypothetical protein